MSQIAGGALFSIFLFVAAILLMAIGRHVRTVRALRHPDIVDSGFGQVEGAVFALMGLLLAFTFSGAGERFNSRRLLLVDEVNAMSAAWAGVDLLPPQAQQPLRDKLREYVDLRIALYRADLRSPAADAAIGRTLALQGEIWSLAVAGAAAAPNPVLVAPVLTAVGAMNEDAFTRLAAATVHPPWIIFALLGVAVLTSALLAGFSMGHSPRSWLHIVGLAGLLAATVYVTIDLEYPRLGLFQISAADDLLQRLRERM